MLKPRPRPINSGPGPLNPVLKLQSLKMSTLSTCHRNWVPPCPNRPPSSFDRPITDFRCASSILETARSLSRSKGLRSTFFSSLPSFFFDFFFFFFSLSSLDFFFFFYKMQADKPLTTSLTHRHAPFWHHFTTWTLVSWLLLHLFWDCASINQA